MNIFKQKPEVAPVPEQFVTNDFGNEVIVDFCCNFGLDISREYLWQLLKLGFTGNISELTVIERENLLHFYEEINVLLEELFRTHDCFVTCDGPVEEEKV